MLKRNALLLIVLLTLSAALPAQNPKGAKPASATPGAVKTEGRCQARTKAGPQCKRKASAGSQYCYQHGGKKK